MRKSIFLAAILGILSGSLTAHATDARMAYKSVGGQYKAVAAVAPTCGVSSAGAPLVCTADGTAGTADARMAYKMANGQYQAVIPTVPVCSVDSSGVPQICDFSSTPDLSSYLTTTAAAATYSQLSGGNSLLGEQRFASAYFADPDQGVSRDAKFGDKGIAVRGGTKTDTLSVTTSAYVPDTTATDSTTAALNTESAAARFVSQTTAASTYATISALNTQVNNAAATYETIANATALAKSTVDALQGSATGDLSASGSSLSMPIGSSGLTLTMSYSASATGSLSIVSASGSITPVDIYETAAWGATSFKGYTLDSGTITTKPTVIDSTFYLSSNAWGTYHIGVGGNLYIVDIFGSGAGKRTILSWRKVL
ncbi:hypothetical protein [Komagataeibacter xylinus]|uniref:Uncharacterized protein n=1 Tax=Komagataeibacter xylinus TaxID=28448 RepID=A0A857FNV3_KOMXY|nr:hypothetical protein [Komagataeibacter xylinus]QHC34174.1 hypothetical protein FMA36_00370 [Komagataeibacter xylinus]